MSKEKILREHLERIIYSNSDWELLKRKRQRSGELLKIFEEYDPYIYGSIARGNIHSESDIDIIFLYPIPIFKIEFALEQKGYNHYVREIIMATPNDSIKLYIYLNELESITVPLTKLDKKSLEFYDFGGKINLKDVNSNLRVSGIDKRLVLIKPTVHGHDEISLIGNELLVAKELNISLRTLNERKKVLLRREKHGRTGVFLKRVIDLNESTEDVLKSLANKKALIRKRLHL